MSDLAVGVGKTIMRYRYIEYFLLVIVGLVLVGCGPTQILPRMDLLDLSKSNTYRDWDWARVLSNYVHDGLVDYDRLSQNPESLQRYYALLSITGPTLTSSQFSNRHHAIAYWINAYNALVLCAVLNKYPTTTMYDLSMPRLGSDYTFSVDGQMRNLSSIEAELLRLSDGDVRVLLATSRAALGTPLLQDRPIRPTILDRQLSEIAATVLDDLHVLSIDHESQSILVWQLILRREDDFVNYMRSRRRARTAFVYNALLDLASPKKKKALNGAVGYMLRPIAFDRALNSHRSAVVP